MANGHLAVKAGGSKCASSHGDYITREGKYLGYKKGEPVEAVQSGNMPSWAVNNPNEFWKSADQYERKNASPYREYEFSLPRELNKEQRLELAKKFIEQEMGDKYVYQFAIHNPKASDGKDQPHCHLMFCERRLDGIERDPEQFFKRYNSKHPERGGAKKDNTGMKPQERKEALKALRMRWEKICNQHLEKAQKEEKISMMSYADRGIEKKPQIHLGPYFHKKEKQAKKTAQAENRKYEPVTIKGKYNKDVSELNNQRQEVRRLEEKTLKFIEQVRTVIKETVEKTSDYVTNLFKINKEYIENKNKVTEEQKQETQQEDYLSGLFKKVGAVQKDLDKKQQQQQPKKEWGNNKPTRKPTRKLRR